MASHRPASASLQEAKKDCTQGKKPGHSPESTDKTKSLIPAHLAGNSCKALLPLLFLEADEDEVSSDEKRTLDEHAVGSEQVILLGLT